MSYASTHSSPPSPVGSAAPARRTAHPEALAEDLAVVLASVAKAAVGAPARLVAALAEHRRQARQVAALEALSDHVLADIGIERPQIRRMVRQGRK
jgi:uncharacterized protein YjiS (DUF1127 family)